MESGLCGFCRRDNVEDICGTLHKEKTAKDGWVVAHHRCMQYCALLVQYKFDHFGGFKIDKVLDEYRRGKHIKCSLCFDKKSKKKNASWRGATAGCAVKSCRRTFHYYCAKMSSTAVTKRLVVHVKSKGEKTVLYRVFCSKEHEQQYRQNLKKYLADLASTGSKKETECVSDSDENKQGDDGDDNGGGAEIDEDILSQNTNSTFIQLSDLESSPVKAHTSKDVKTELRRFSSSSNDDDSDADSSDNRTSNANRSDSDSPRRKRKQSGRGGTESGEESDSGSGGPKKKKKKSSLANGHAEDKGSRSDSGHSSSGSRGKRSESGPGSKEKGKGEKKTEKTATPQVNKKLTVNMIKLKRTSLDGSSSGAAGDWKTARKSPAKRGIELCAVCIVGEPDCSQKLQQHLEKVVCKQFNIKPKQFFLWQHLDNSPTLPKQNMVYFIKDLAKHFMDGDIEEVDKLLFDGNYLSKKDKTQYKLQGAFLQDLGDDIIKKTQELVWSNIQSQLANNEGVGSVVKAEGKQNLVLMLSDDGIDIDGKLREKLGITEDETDMISWTPATVVTKMAEDDDQEMGMLEKDTILAWIEANAPPVSHVFVHPQEEILMPRWEGGTVADDIATHLQAVKKEGKQMASVMVFKQVDDEVVNFQPYCRKAIQKVLPSCVSTGRSFLVVLDIRSLTNKNIHQQLKDVFTHEEGSPLPVTLRSAFDPSSIPVSCVVAEIDTEQLKVQMCAVCIVGEPDCSQKLQQHLEKVVCKQFNIKPKQFFLWQHLDNSPTLPKQNMVYFIKDLAKHFMDGDIEEVDKLLFDGNYLSKKDKTQYKLQGAFLQDLGADIIKKTQELVWSNIQSQLANNEGVGSVVKAEGKQNLVLMLSDDGIDIDGKLREKLGITEDETDMISWTPATVVTKMAEDDDQEMGMLEKDTILAWIEANAPPVSHVFVHPQEEILMPRWEGGTVADDIATHLQAVKKEGKQMAAQESKVKCSNKSSPQQKHYVSDNQTPSTSCSGDRSRNTRRSSPRGTPIKSSVPSTPSTPTTRLSLNKTKKK